MNENYIEKTLDDHENRIRTLEQSNLELKYQLSDIQKGQTEIKLSINETQNKLLDTMTKLVNNNNKTDNEMKFYNTKQFWILVAGLIALFGSVITYFCGK